MNQPDLLGVSAVLLGSGHHHYDRQDAKRFVARNLLKLAHYLPAADQSVGILLTQLSADDVDQILHPILRTDSHRDPPVISDIFTCELHAASLLAGVETLHCYTATSLWAGCLTDFPNWDVKPEQSAVSATWRNIVGKRGWWAGCLRGHSLATRGDSYKTNI